MSWRKLLQKSVDFLSKDIDVFHEEIPSQSSQNYFCRLARASFKNTRVWLKFFARSVGKCSKFCYEIHNFRRMVHHCVQVSFQGVSLSLISTRRSNFFEHALLFAEKPPIDDAVCSVFATKFSSHHQSWAGSITSHACIDPSSNYLGDISGINKRGSNSRYSC